ncbi:MAG: hypothetical protein EON91_02715 [Brevundimonas sp.]|uniref:hypothetical protein n=1 Tax=Brevundimonas sp. TaxID=1871086 RepID=UPI00120DA0F7|nr:hypothetical protein [Brevundimonas sp.]RZJ19126.1 MAG: hypothetical protein EON91_02715 [Brevundimonas sp.]
MSGSATVGALRVTLGLDSAAFTDGLSAAQKHLQTVGGKLQSVGQTMATVGAGMSAAITAPFIALGSHLLQGSQDAAAAAGQVNAALESMGGASGKTFEQLEKTAVTLRDLSGMDDDEILTKVTANLLTFGNVAGDVFDRAQLSILNVSARLGQDLQASTMMVGKALNDPIRGLAALRRVGIQFTAQQEDQIRAMQGVGDMAGAQAIMLGELERQFGGAAEAAGNADVWKPLKTALMELEGAFEPLIRDVVGPLIQRVADLARTFAGASPEVQKFALIGAAVAAALGPVLIVLGGVVAAVGTLLPVIGAIGAPFLAMGAAVAGVVLIFYAFRDEIIPIVQSFAASIQANIGPKLAPLWEALKGAVGAVGEVFAAIFGDGSPDSASANLKLWGEVVSRVFGAAIDIITGAINVVSNILRALGALLRGDFSAMWGYLGAAVMAALRGIANAFQTLFPEVVAWAQRTFEGVKSWLLDRFEAVVRGIGEKVARVKGFFRDLWDAVVGHSYIPDMVVAIADWMGPRLKDAMVDPALAAVSQTDAAFQGLGASVEATMDSVLKSISSRDWSGALAGIFDMLSGQGGKLGALGKIGSAIMGALPGFKTGGSFRVGGSGGPDSQLTAFRTTPGEMVDIRRPGRDSGTGGGHVFDLRGALVTEDLLSQINQRVAAGEARAVRTATRVGQRSLAGIQQSYRRLGST